MTIQPNSFEYNFLFILTIIVEKKLRHLRHFTKIKVYNYFQIC